MWRWHQAKSSSSRRDPWSKNAHTGPFVYHILVRETSFGSWKGDRGLSLEQNSMRLRAPPGNVLIEKFLIFQGVFTIITALCFSIIFPNIERRSIAKKFWTEGSQFLFHKKMVVFMFLIFSPGFENLIRIFCVWAIRTTRCVCGEKIATGLRRLCFYKNHTTY